MLQFLKKNHRLLFYGCWLLLNIVQSGLTELLDDEAYYWAYSRFLDWGYYDHPPMIGLLVKLGYAVFPNELGVRLLPLLLNIFSLLLIESLIEKKRPFLFYGIALSIAVLQVTGFVAVPDTPLIFFTALFFVTYKRFSVNASLLNTLLLGLAITFLLYSKYHAVLIVFFTLLSDIRLLTRYQIYLAGCISLLLFIPHLVWQYQHDWVSFRYHLLESNVNDYRFSFTLEYLVGQLLLPGPFAGFILLPAALLYRPISKNEKALRFTLIGIYVFFLLSSFRGRVEANWTSPVLVPLMVLSHRYLADRPDWVKWLIRTVPATLLLVLVARVLMVADIVPIKFIQQRYHAWKDWPAKMHEATRGLPVVFSNSYQRASKYWFYTGQPTYSQNHYIRRKNNYNYWPLEDSLLGKETYFMDIHAIERFPDSMAAPIRTIGYMYDPFFLSFAKIHIEPEQQNYQIGRGDSLLMSCHVEMPEHYRQFIRSNTFQDDTVRIGVFNKSGWVKDLFVPWSLEELASEKTLAVQVAPDLSKGSYYLRFAINCGYRNPTHNSDKIALAVE